MMRKQIYIADENAEAVEALCQELRERGISLSTWFAEKVKAEAPKPTRARAGR